MKIYIYIYKKENIIIIKKKYTFPYLIYMLYNVHQ